MCIIIDITSYIYIVRDKEKVYKKCWLEVDTESVLVVFQKHSVYGK